MTSLSVFLFVLASVLVGSRCELGGEVCYATDDPQHSATDWNWCAYGCCQDYWVFSTDDMCCDDPSIWVDPGYVGGFSAGVVFFVIFFILGCCRYRARRRIIVRRTVVAQAAPAVTVATVTQQQGGYSNQGYAPAPQGYAQPPPGYTPGYAQPPPYPGTQAGMQQSMQNVVKY